MEKIINGFLVSLPHNFLGLAVLVVVIIATLLVLGKAADVLVDCAVDLSKKFHVPKMIIGATIVSLGTTLPEVTVSVVSALKGFPGLAMGNAVGSIICDTGLILGVAALIRPLPFDKKQINTQGWLQVFSALILYSMSAVFGLLCPVQVGLMAGIDNSAKKFVGGFIPQGMGFFLLFILVMYIIATIKSGCNNKDAPLGEPQENIIPNFFVFIVKMLLAFVFVVLSSKVLILAVQEFALRLNIPETVIAATLVAFGTSLPELVTGIVASHKGHGDLAIGNVLGADILNALLVVGAATCVTPQGLFVDMTFFRLLFPAMMFILIIFRASSMLSKNTIKRPVGVILLLSYIIVTAAGYITAT